MARPRRARGTARAAPPARPCYGLRMARASPIALLFAASVLTLGGCLAPTRDAIVDVRDAATDAPAPGVAVKVTTLNPQHVLRVSDYTRWLAGGPEDDEPIARTGDDGSRAVRIPTDRPFMLNLLLPGAIPESLHFREIGDPDAPFPASDWITVPVGVDQPRYAVRIRPKP